MILRIHIFCHLIFTLKYPTNGQKAFNAKIYKVVWVIDSLFRIFLRREAFQVLPFSTDELSTAYVRAKLSVFLKSKGDFTENRVTN